MSTEKKAKTIVLIEKLRLIESEIFLIASKYGVKTVDELDGLIERGKLSESESGGDVFMLDYLLTEKEKIEIDLKKLSINKSSVWKSLQNLLDLPKLSFPR